MSENERLFSILNRLSEWSLNPTLTVAQTIELTSLSRARVRQLIERGSFCRGGSSGDLLFLSILQHFSSRAESLKSEGKPLCKQYPKELTPKRFSSRVALPR